MRTLLALALFTAACTTNAPAGSDTSRDSVRERLADAPALLFIGGADSAGSVTARRWTPGGWIEGDHALTVETGELAVSVDGSGKLSVQAFEVGVAPIEIPEEVFKKPAQLTDVRVKLTEAAVGAATWTSDNEATARLSLKLDLEWSISVNGGKTPLGEQHLPSVDVDFTIYGDGDYVGATLDLAAAGELWDWAGLLEMTRLELALNASTAD